MDIPVNANAKYMRVRHSDGCYTLIDMNDIIRIGLGEQVMFKDKEQAYTVAIIDWKAPYSDQWQVFIDKYSLELWKDFCSKPSKNVDK